MSQSMILCVTSPAFSIRGKVESYTVIGIGTRVGRLVVEAATDQRKAGYIIWKCRCDCGGEITAELGQLTAGYRKSCGCLSHPARKDLTGQRFGRLTVTGYAGKENGMHRWRCVCDCGKETVAGQSLLQFIVHIKKI